MKSTLQKLAVLLYASIALSAWAASGANGGGSTVGPGTTGQRMYEDFTRNLNTAPGQIVPGNGGGGNACPPGPVSWTVNAACDGSIPAAVPNGGTSPVVNDTTGPATGSASFTCSNGVFTQAPGATCSTAQCPAGPVTWSVGGNTCTANLAVQNSGDIATATDATAPTTGTASYSCNNGTRAENPGSSCTGSATCSGAVTWTVGADTCNGTLPATVASGSTSGTVTDSTAPTTGSATFTCNNGTSVANSGATCAAPAAMPGWCVNIVTSTYTFPASALSQLPPATPIQYVLAGGGPGGSGPGTNCTNCTMASQRVTGSFTPNAEFYVYVGGGGGSWTTTQPVSGGGGGAGWAGGGGGGYGNPSFLVQTGSSGAGGSTAISYAQTAAATALVVAPGLQGSFGTGGTPTGGGTNAGGNGSLGGTAGTRFDGGNAGRTGSTNVTYFPAGGKGVNGSNGGGSNGADGAASGQGGGGFGGGGAGSGTGGGRGAMSMAPMVSAAGAAITLPAEVGRANGSGGASGGHGGNAGIAVLRYPTTTGICAPGFTNIASSVQASCSGGVSWTVGGNTCSGTLPATIASGATSGTVTDSTAPTTGSSTFTCNNGTATQTAGATCNATATCSGAVSWTVGGNTCSGTLPATVANGATSGTVTDNTAPTTGSSTFTCSNGTATQRAGATCSVAAAPVCAAGRTVNWTAGLQNCSTTLPSQLSEGQTVSVNDTAAPGVGTAEFVCTNGNPVRTAAAATCAAVAPPLSCSGRTLSWTVNSTPCAGNAPTTNSGGTAPVTSSNGNIGNASFSCSNGNFAATPANGATCTLPPPSTTQWCVNTVTTRLLVSAADLATYPTPRPMEYALAGGGRGGICGAQSYAFEGSQRFCNVPGQTGAATRISNTFIPTFPFEVFVGGGGGAAYADANNIPNLRAGAGGAGWNGGGGGGISTNGTTPGSNYSVSTGAGGSTAIVNRTTNQVVGVASGAAGTSYNTGVYVALSIAPNGGDGSRQGAASNYGGTDGAPFVGGNFERALEGGNEPGSGGQQALGGSNGGGSNGGNGSGGSSGAGGGGFGSGGSGLFGEGGLGANSFANNVIATGADGPGNIVLPPEAGAGRVADILQGGNAGIAVLRYRPNATNLQCIPGFTLR